MSLSSGESAAITALRSAFNDGRGRDDEALQIATDIIGLLKTWLLEADVEPGGGPPPLTAPSGGGAVTGTGKLA